MATETVLTNVRLVLEDDIVLGSIVLRDGRIAEISDAPAPSGEDFEGDYLIPGLVEGLGDIAASNLTITPERLQLVDFSVPVASGVKEIVVAGPGAPEIRRADDLSGQEKRYRPPPPNRAPMQSMRSARWGSATR